MSRAHKKIWEEKVREGKSSRKNGKLENVLSIKKNLAITRLTRTAHQRLRTHGRGRKASEKSKEQLITQCEQYAFLALVSTISAIHIAKGKRSRKKGVEGEVLQK